jgi:RHS repeat-associated protein
MRLSLIMVRAAFATACMIAEALCAATLTWVGGSGNWSQPTNWSTGTLPAADDDVVIDVPEAIAVTLSAGNHSIRTLRSEHPFTLSGGTLTVASTMQVNHTLTLSGGTLAGATLVRGTDNAVIRGWSGTLSSVTLAGEIHMDSGRILTVQNGLTLAGGTITLAASVAQTALNFPGAQTLGGSGAIVFDGSPDGFRNRLQPTGAGATLTMGPDVTIRTGTGSGILGTTDGTFVHRGTLMVETGRAVAVLGQGWRNEGTWHVDAGTLELGGAFTRADLGDVQRQSGTIRLTGTLDNRDITFSLDEAGGPWVMAGGSILGGTLEATAATALVGSISGGLLDGVTLHGDLLLTAQGSWLRVTNGLTLHGTTTIGAGTLSFNNRLEFAGSQSLDGTGTVVFSEGRNTGLEAVTPGMTLTLGPGLTVRGGTTAADAGHIGYIPARNGPANVSVINQGTISADLNGRGLVVHGQAFRNDGLAQATQGGGLTLASPWTNPGTLVVDGGTLNLRGAFRTVDLGTVQRKDGTVQLSGALDNREGTVFLDEAGGPWVMTGGSVLGGTLEATTTTALVGSINGGLLDGVTLRGDLLLTAQGSWLRVTNGLTLHGTTTIGAGTLSFNNRLEFAGSQSLDGTGTVVFSEGRNTGLEAVTPGMTLTLGPGLTVRGGTTAADAGHIGYIPARNGPANVSVINQGTISADLNGRGLVVHGQAFRNDGLAQATQGGGLTLASPWTNPGTLVVDGGTLNLRGAFRTVDLGTVQRKDGTVQLSGALDNREGTVFLDEAGGPWVMTGGSVLGGTLEATTTTALVGSINGGLLDGVTLRGDLLLTAQGSWLRVTNGLTLHGTTTIGAGTLSFNNRLEFAGSQSLDGTGTVVFSEGRNTGLEAVTPGMTLTLGPGLTVRGGTTAADAGHIGYIPARNGPANVSVINQGTISADLNGRGLVVHGQGFDNIGTLRAAAGGRLTILSNPSTSTGTIEVLAQSLVNFRGSPHGSEAGAYLSQPLSTVRIGGHLLGTTQNPLLFSPRGTTRFDGVGTMETPQLLEVMSPDLGPEGGGLGNAFAYGTLALASNTFVRLVDQATNSPGTNTEAVYVQSLIVPAGCTLDLDGLRVYARSIQVLGNILNGAIIPIPDSGPIQPAIPTPGTIGTVGEVDEWTFPGRAGRSYVILVETGSATVPMPRLSFAAVRLLDPSGSILTQGNNTGSGQTILLSTLPLPTDSTYRIQVTAPPTQPSATGHYRIALWDATPNLAALELTQPAHGRIDTPYRVESWTFSAPADLQVRFEFINASAPGVAFSLEGPDGWTGFTDLVEHSDLILLPTHGRYTLTARGIDGAHGIDYAFRLAETPQTTLAVGDRFTGSWGGNGHAQLFLVSLNHSGPVRITLHGGPGANRTELYAARGRPPTRGDFEWAAASGPDPDRDLLIPSVSPGTLYLLVYGEHVPAQGQFDLQVTAAGLILTSLSPAGHAHDTGFDMTLAGAGFESGTRVELLGPSGLPAATVTNVVVNSFTELTAEFPPDLAPPGRYSVRVTQPDGDTDTLIDAFEMLPAGTPRFITRLVLPPNLGRHAVATLHIEYANEGTAAMHAPLLVLRNADPADSNRPILTLDASRIIQNYWGAGLPPGTAHEVYLLASGTQPGILNPGERFTIPVHYLGLLRPWDMSNTGIRIEIRYWTAEDPSPLEWPARRELLRPRTLDATTWDILFDNVTASLSTMGDFVRMLGRNARALGQLGRRVTHVNALWNFELRRANGFTIVPRLDQSVDALVPTPGIPLALSRRFPSGIRARNALGWFGHGWYSPWQAHLVVEGDGDLVKLVGEAGTVRIFTRDTRDGGYFSGPGDASTLVALGAAQYDLRDPNGVRTRYRHDGRIEYMENPHGNRTTAIFDNAGRLVALTNNAGGFLALSYNAAGLADHVTDSTGRTVTYAYSGSYLQTVTRDDGQVTTYTYEHGGTPAQRHALRSITRRGTTRHYAYDSGGRLSSTHVANQEQRVDYGYDDAGGVSATNADGTRWIFFDDRGLVARLVDPLGHVTTAAFDNDFRVSRLTAPTGDTQLYDWCDCGSLGRFTDELGHTTWFDYDHPLRRLTRSRDALGNSTLRTHDSLGNRLTTVYPNGSAEHWNDHDSFGQARTHTNRRGQTTHFEYTPSGQIARQTFADGRVQQFEYNARGNLTALRERPEPGVERVTRIEYDLPQSADRIRRITDPTGRWIEFHYDAHGRRERLADAAGHEVRYQHDDAGRLWRVRDAEDVILAHYTYSASGRLQRVDRSNGTHTTLDYDAAGQLIRLANHLPDGRVSSAFDYHYDARGRRIAMNTHHGDWTCHYDAKGRMTRARFISREPTIPDQDLEYHYDALGNRTVVLNNGASVEYTVNRLNQYTSVNGVAFAYDADGNLTHDGVRHYHYDDQNRLVSVLGPEGLVEYEHNGFGQRTAMIVNGVRTEYLIDPMGHGNVVAEFDGAGALLATMVHGLGLLARSETGSPLTFYEYDAQGFTAGITDHAGQSIARYAYEPFGSELLSEGPPSNPFRQVGQFGVAQMPSGELFARARSYRPDLGRFLSIDPLALDGGDANLYTWVDNSPVNFVDPEGMRGRVIYEPEIKDPKTKGTTTGYYDPNTGDIHIDSRFPFKDCVLVHEMTHKFLHENGMDLPCNADEVAASIAGLTCGVLKGRRYYIAQQFTKLSLIMGGWDYCDDDDDDVAKDVPPGGPGSPGSPGALSVSTSVDPNDKTAAGGVGPGNWVPSAHVIPYRIRFENLGPGSVDAEGNPYSTFATAPAQRVTITDPLPDDLDWTTFQLVELGFGDVSIHPPQGSRQYASSIPTSFNNRSFHVEISVKLEPETGRVFAAFQSIDPATSLPPDVLTGFLPPEDGTGRGQGHLSFMIQPRPGLPTGTPIRNVAFIEFDRQLTIATNQRDPLDPNKGTDPNLEALVTVDADPPTSRILLLPPEITSPFDVSWSGEDTGSGIASYTILVSVNGGPWAPWLDQTTATSARFHGEPNHEYAFLSTARDHTGNLESPKSAAEAVTRVVSTLLDYHSWLEDYFPPQTLNDPTLAESAWGAHADPDGDGLPNLAEFFHGRNPVVAEPTAALEIAVEGEWVRLSFAQAKGREVEHVVQWSATLADWSTEGLQLAAVEDLGAAWRIEARILHANAPTLFLRLRLLLPTP